MAGFSEELAKWVTTKPKDKARRESLAEFLAVEDKVKEGVQAGYSLKTIWLYLHEKGSFTFTYQTFAKVAKKHIAVTATPKNNDDEKPSGFSYSAKGKKEDLL